MKIQRYEVETLAEAIGAEKAAKFKEIATHLMRGMIDDKSITAWQFEGAWYVGQNDK